MYFYIKHAHVGVIPGVIEYATEFVNANGDDGYLIDLGLIPVDEDLMAKNQDAVANLPELTAENY